MIRSVLSTAVRRHRLPAPVASLQSRTTRGHHALAVAAAEATDSTKDSSHWIFLVVASSLAVASSSVAVVATRCDDNDDDNDDNDNDNANANDNDDDDEVEEDPYDNLPEEDEPTHCSICMSYRQGPCRPYWRKVEACMKANESKKEEDDDKKKEEEDDESDEPRPDPPCFKYMMPWIDCAQGYSNLYNLIELDTNYTEGIADLEKDATQSLCWAPSHEPKIDWSTWQTYVEENEEWKLPKKKKTTSTSEKVSLWKTLDQSKDPQLVNVEATVPMTLGEGVLECAYAVDQDGYVIGFSYGTRPSEAAEKKGADKHENPSVPLTIRIVPTRTRRVTIAASYTQPKKEDAEDAEEKDPRESHIYKSRPYSLKKMGQK